MDLKTAFLQGEAYEKTESSFVKSCLSAISTIDRSKNEEVPIRSERYTTQMMTGCR